MFSNSQLQRSCDVARMETPLVLMKRRGGRNWQFRLARVIRRFHLTPLESHQGGKGSRSSTKSVSFAPGTGSASDIVPGPEMSVLGLWISSQMVPLTGPLGWFHGFGSWGHYGHGNHGSFGKGIAGISHSPRVLLVMPGFYHTPYSLFDISNI